MRDNLMGGMYRAYRPAIATYGQVFSGAVERCQASPFDAPDLNTACRYARHIWGTGAFAVMRKLVDGKYQD
jgi:hypothetical protein